jgi:alanine racemase
MEGLGSGRTSWVEVSRGALQANFDAVRKYAGTAVCAVVKANAYGCGLIECATIFHRAGARMVAVTRVEEARALRDAGVAADILVLAPPPRRSREGRRTTRSDPLEDRHRHGATRDPAGARARDRFTHRRLR